MANKAIVQSADKKDEIVDAAGLKAKIPLTPGDHTKKALGERNGRIYSLVRVSTPSQGIRLAICEYVSKWADAATLDAIDAEIDSGKKSGIRGIETRLVPEVLKDLVNPVSLQFFENDEELTNRIFCSEFIWWAGFFIEGGMERFPKLLHFEKFAKPLQAARSW